MHREIVKHTKHNANANQVQWMTTTFDSGREPKSKRDAELPDSSSNEFGKRESSAESQRCEPPPA